MNRLADESSPYLRQHASNPVDWYPWGPEAFDRARAEDRPLLVSIGYSACHWCHVMAHESFEDAGTAAVMNDLFVNIKVDREERPDIDAIYMEAAQALTGSGGWPLTVFVAPDGRPLFAGTYFPPIGSHGRPGFTDLLRAVSDAWINRRAELLEQADQIADAVRSRVSVAPPTGEVAVSAAMVDRAKAALTEAFDPEWGGFGRAPKFPMPGNLELLLRTATGRARDRDAAALDIVTTTLDAMASGGMYDHLGGGFARYAVDRSWLVPHFEKMLYDNALLARVYLHAHQCTGDDRYRQVAEETIEYVLRDLRHAEGAFFSAEDADSEGVEGRFYVWTEDQLRGALSTAGLGASYDAVAAWYGVTPEGNFGGEHGLERATILHRSERGRWARPPAVEDARRVLLDARGRRVRPGLDDKVLTEWNAMMIATLAEAGAALGRPDYVEAAEQAMTFLRAALRRSDGRWLRAWQQDGGPRHLAYAEDYAHLVDAATRLAEATGRRRWTTEALEYAEGLLDLFWDDEAGGLFTVGHDAEPLLVRAKDVYDGAVPSANSTAALALLRLSHRTGHERYAQAAEGILRLLHDHLDRAPTSVTVALAAVDLLTAGVTEIVVSARPDLAEAVQRRYLPRAVLAWGEPDGSPAWDGRERPGAYVCRDRVCGLPATTVEELLTQIAGATTPG